MYIVCIAQSNLLKSGIILVPYLTFILLSLIPIKAFSQKCENPWSNSHLNGKRYFSTRKDIFEIPPLNKKKYSTTELEKAMNSTDYSKVIKEYPKIKNEIEIELVKLYQEHNNNRAFQILFLSNIILVRHIVKDYIRKNSGSFEDLFQEGLIAMLDSIKKFNSTKGVKLSTYIDRVVRRNISRYNEMRDSLVAIKWTTQWKKLQISLLDRLSTHPANTITENWIRKFAEENPQYSMDDVRSVLSILLRGKTYISLHDPVSPNNGKNLTLLDNLSDQKADVEKKAMDRTEFLKIYNWTMEELKDRRELYKMIVRERLFSSNPRTQLDIAQEFNVSRPLVAKIEIFIRNMIKNQFSNH